MNSEDREWEAFDQEVVWGWLFWDICKPELEAKRGHVWRKENSLQRGSEQSKAQRERDAAFQSRGCPQEGHMHA